MNYSVMSNEEINVEVAKELGFTNKAFLDSVADGSNPLYGEKFDPCNSWSDLSEITGRYDIELRADHINKCYVANYINVGETFKGYAYHDYSDKNPLRAICIVFLMIKGINL